MHDVTPAAVELDARTAAEQFLRDSTCSKPRCKCLVSARRGHGLTHCPLHADQTPSFNVSVKGDRLLVYCETGTCDQAAVIEVMKDAGVWPQKADYGKQIIAEYDYRAADGRLLYQAVRYMPKDFRQRKPNGPNTWTWSMAGVDLVPYRLPEIVSSGERVVFVVEGEKDVDRLTALGFVATCNIGGAGKWRDDYTLYLRGRHVVIVPDHDEAGLQHGLGIARSLNGQAKKIGWLDLPGLDDHGDVSDWLDDGGTSDEFKRLAAMAGDPPAPRKRERLFVAEGLGYRIEPAQAPIVARFSNIADFKDKTTAELRVTRADGQFVLRRSVNLLAASGPTFTGLVDDLKEEALGLDVDWKRMLRDEFEAVLDAHRNGLVLETVGGHVAAPKPIQWLCEDLLLKDKLNCWLASASTGKSTLAKALCVCYVAGKPFLGREMGVPGAAMYLDWEDDRDDLERVAYEVSRGLDIWPVPNIHWVNMRGRRLRDHIDGLGRHIAEQNVKLVVIDAIAAAGGSPGEHMSWEAVALELEQCLGQLPPVTVLALDHITSDEHKNGTTVVPTKGRGAVRKVEFFRNQWTLMLDKTQMMATRQHIVSWYHTKINRGTPRPEFTIEIVHGDGRMTFRDGTVEDSPEAVERLPLYQQYVMAVRRTPGLSTEDVCLEVRGEADRNKVLAARGQLTRQQRRGEVWSQGDRWYPAGHPGPSESENIVGHATLSKLPYRDD